MLAHHENVYTRFRKSRSIKVRSTYSISALGFVLLVQHFYGEARAAELISWQYVIRPRGIQISLPLINRLRCTEDRPRPVCCGISPPCPILSLPHRAQVECDIRRYRNQTYFDSISRFDFDFDCRRSGYHQCEVCNLLCQFDDRRI